MEAYLTVFIAVTAAAVVLQAALLVATYLRLSKLDEETRSLRRHLNDQAGPILRNLSEITLTVRENSRLIFDDLTALSQDARRQMDKFDRLTDELADRLRLQIIHLDELLRRTLENLEKAGSAMKDTVAGPVREAAAVLQGVKAAFDLISARRSRGRAEPRPTDEQLFI